MSVEAVDLADGLVLIGSQFNEPMRVVGNPAVGDGFVTVHLVGTRTSTFRSGVTLTKDDLAKLQIERKEALFQGKPRLFKLGLEALRISLAQEYDPFFGLSISRVDPLPHQLDAVYNHLLKSARCRFLLADDAGAGKAIMAGLLLKDLRRRGLVDKMDDAEREARERELERATLARRNPDLEAELAEIAELIDHGQRVENGGHEIKLSRLKAQLTASLLDASTNDGRLLKEDL